MRIYHDEIAPLCSISKVIIYKIVRAFKLGMLNIINYDIIIIVLLVFNGVSKVYNLGVIKLYSNNSYDHKA